MLYKYLFYSVSYLVRKYDRFWEVGNDYYFWGASIVGLIIGITIYDILNIIGLFFIKSVVWYNYGIMAYIPIPCSAILSIIYFKRKNKFRFKITLKD